MSQLVSFARDANAGDASATFAADRVAGRSRVTADSTLETRSAVGEAALQGREVAVAPDRASTGIHRAERRHQVTGNPLDSKSAALTR